VAGGCLFTRTPLALVRELLRQRRTGLTLARNLMCTEGELMMAAGGHRKENEFWLATLGNLAARFGQSGEPTLDQICVDRRRQWRRAANLQHNAAIRSGLWSMGHPIQTVRRLVNG